MSNENYLDKVYTVGESDPDHGNNSSGDETDRDPRRGAEGRSFMTQYLILQP